MNYLPYIFGFALFAIYHFTFPYMLIRAERQSFNKSDILRFKKETGERMIMDKEIEIETHWRLLNAAQEQTEKYLKQIEEKQEEVKTIKAKKRYADGDMSKIVELELEIEKLGWTGKRQKNDDPIYEGLVLAADIETERYRTSVAKVVMEREVLKAQLQSINSLILKGFKKDFEKFKEESLKWVLDEEKKKQ